MSQWINLSVKLQVDCLLDMDVSVQKTDIMEEPSSMTPLLALFGLRIKSLWALVRLLCPSTHLSNGCMNLPVLKSSVIIVTMVSLLLMNFVRIAKTSNRSNHSLALEPNTKMPVPSDLFRPSCIWQEHLCFMSHYIGMKMEQIIWPCGHLQSSMQSGCTIVCQIASLDLHLWSC